MGSRAHGVGMMSTCAAFKLFGGSQNAGGRGVIKDDMSASTWVNVVIDTIGTLKLVFIWIFQIETLKMTLLIMPFEFNSLPLYNYFS